MKTYTNLFPAAELGRAAVLKQNGYNYFASMQMFRADVERIVRRKSTPKHILVNFKKALRDADKLIRGKNEFVDNETRKPMKFPPERILFVLYADGLKVWID